MKLFYQIIRRIHPQERDCLLVWPALNPTFVQLKKITNLSLVRVPPTSLSFKHPPGMTSLSQAEETVWGTSNQYHPPAIDASLQL